ncbi:hypothetical protein BD626DRAFT_633028 [Schizophyllum amplum]|uniref:Uncharacterized protein n=1 Tax=Schizophyllum amplum TaxID=97359 RepID=A0A550C4N0_9AGAR|nr:hypothetical protein BD626DRAFT_633028 [Auriculariopsis ampla]
MARSAVASSQGTSRSRRLYRNPQRHRCADEEDNGAQLRHCLRTRVGAPATGAACAAAHYPCWGSRCGTWEMTARPEAAHGGGAQRRHCSFAWFRSLPVRRRQLIITPVGVVTTLRTSFGLEHALRRYFIDAFVDANPMRASNTSTPTYSGR